MKMKLVLYVMLCAVLFIPTIAYAEAANGNVGYGVTTPGRLWATIDAVAGLIAAIFAGLSLARSAGRFRTGAGNGRRGAILSGVAGLIVITYAMLHLTIYTGDFGTGDGRAGAIIAIVMGLIGMGLAGLTIARSR
ncbi:DUF6223 family protein [Paenibacillus ginsengarvi]|uniref:Uncharacterized protein n=1 Tax=Paenibacillus ginsengarvi TaxID=400777 RepID=A0A3B0CRG3_9BACL|nr:DUF6223 family protein [Paenibacillus ginsengarvi]RKN86169.1 hypothetical protein D7M11_03935 [Paenibacillus ginsengarvi]